MNFLLYPLMWWNNSDDEESENSGGGGRPEQKPEEDQGNVQNEPIEDGIDPSYVVAGAGVLAGTVILFKVMG